MSVTAANIQLDPGFWTKTSRIQLFYGVWVNMTQLGIGMAFALSAVQVPQLSKPTSSIKITRDEAAWIASVLTLFSPIGCMISGYMMDKFGRKIMLILCQGPMCLGWLYTGFAVSANHIIIGRAITGIGCGMAMGAPRLYITEISLPNMRGVIGAFSSTAISVGICVQAGLGALGCAWQVLCYVCSAFTLFNLITYNLLPETPYYILKTSTIEHARLTLAKFRDKDYNIEDEMDQLIDFKLDNNIRKLSLRENLCAMCSRPSCKPFVIINTYILIAQASGSNAILTWAIEILTVAKSSFDPEAGNLLLGITRLFMSTMTSILLFRVGRKPLALLSAAGVSFVCFVLGLYVYYNDDLSLMPQLCLMAFIAFASLGYYILPFLMMGELFPLQVRGSLTGITVSLTSLLIFGFSKCYPVLADSIGLANTIIVYGACSLLGTAFLFFFLPETKDLTLQEIEEYFNERRPTLVSQRLVLSMQLLESSNKSIVKLKSKTKMQRSNRGIHNNDNPITMENEAERKQSVRRMKLNNEADQKSSKIATNVSDSPRGRNSYTSEESRKSDESDKNKQSKKSKRSKESARIMQSEKMKLRANVVIRGSDDTLLSNTEGHSNKDKPSTSKE